MNRVLIVLAIAGTTLLAATPSPSSTPSPSANPSASSSPNASPHPAPSGPDTFQVGVWTVHASLLDVNFKTGDFSTPDKVTMTRGGGDITADRASGNYKSKAATLYGHVVVHDTQGNFAGVSSSKPATSRGPSTLTADQVHIDGVGKIYTATGNVHYVQADTTVDADKGVLDDLTHDLDLTGNAKIVQGDRNMEADHVLYNTISGQAHAEGDPVTMQFPSEVNAHIATPRPLHVKNPLQKKAPPTPSPAP
jgi:lipopolysaccharide assembly outer membrane protein LptD (OstA)